MTVLADFAALGGHVDHVMSLEQALRRGAWQDDGAPLARRWVAPSADNVWPLGHVPMLG